MSNPEYRDAPGPWTRADQKEAHAADLTEVVQSATDLMKAHMDTLDATSAANSPEAKNEAVMNQLLDEYISLCQQQDAAPGAERDALTEQITAVEAKMTETRRGQEAFDQQLDEVLEKANKIGTLAYSEKLAAQEAEEEEAMIEELHRVFVSQLEHFQERATTLFGDISLLPTGSKRTALSTMYLKTREEYREFVGQLRDVKHSIEGLTTDASSATLAEWKSFVKIISGLNGQLEMIEQAGHFHQQE